MCSGLPYLGMLCKGTTNFEPLEFAVPRQNLLYRLLILYLCGNEFNAVFIAVGMAVTVVWGVIGHLTPWKLIYLNT